MRTLWMLLPAVTLLCHGCAIFNRDNTRVLNWFEATAIPRKSPAKTIAYPVLIPAGLVAVGIDGLIVHPIASVDDALRDTDDICWQRFQWDTQYVTECAKLPIRTIGTPVIAVGSLVLRSLFDIRPNLSDAEQERRRSAEPPPSPLPPQPEPVSAIADILDICARSSISVRVLFVQDPPRWATLGPQIQKGLVNAILDESELAPLVGQPPGPWLCWVILRGPGLFRTIRLNEQGFFVGAPGPERFFNPQLATMLLATAESHGLPAGERGDLWRRALQNAAGLKDPTEKKKSDTDAVSPDG